MEKLHEQDQQTHQQDQQTIQQLQQRLGETQTLATNAEQKAEAAAKIQPVNPVASGALSALHNFTMVGDAEVQYGQAKGQNGTFSLADFAPIFLFRANDNILFEAGFDVTLQNNVDATTGHAQWRQFDFGEFEFRPVGLPAQRLRDGRGRLHDFAAGHLFRALGGLAQQDTG